MKFKKWLEESTVGTSVLNGGIGEAPNDGINIGFPVRSRFSCQDGSPPKEKQDKVVTPDEIFGFKAKKDKKRSQERDAMTIDKKDRFPLTTIKPSSIGFSQW